MPGEKGRKKMKKIIMVMMLALLMLTASCKGKSTKKNQPEEKEMTKYELQSEPDMERLKELYPEFFGTEKEPAKGIEVYIWEMAEDSYCCGLMYGTNRNKTEQEIWALDRKVLSVEEAKAILNELQVSKEDIFVIPVIQPYSSYYYEIDDAYRKKVQDLFN